MASTDAGRQAYTLAEVGKHKTKEDIWVVIHGKGKWTSDIHYKLSNEIERMRLVYNISSYPDHHPGGLEILLDVAGTDATENFDYVGHSADAEETLRGFEIGDLSGYV